MDSIQQASKNVNVLLKEKFAVPPVPIRSIRRQKNRAKSKIDDFYTVVNVPDILDVFEVWKLILNDSEYSEVFVVISATCEMAGYKKAKWSNVEYRGFYSTVDEAIHDIYGNLA